MSCSNGIIDIALVIDVSPSVLLADVISACQSGIDAIKAANLADGDDRRALLVTFSYLYHYSTYYIGDRAHSVGLTNDLDNLRALIGALGTGSSSDLAYAISLTRTMLESTSRVGAQVSIILVSDGQWNKNLNPDIGESDPVPVIADMLASHTDWKFFAVDITSAAPPAGVPGDVMVTCGRMGNGYAAGTTYDTIAAAIVRFADPCSNVNIGNTVHGRWYTTSRIRRC
jgi:hypothetical protein